MGDTTDQGAEELARVLSDTSYAEHHLPNMTTEYFWLSCKDEYMSYATAVFKWLRTQGYAKAGWRAIATAPKDWTTILLCRDDGDYFPLAGYWNGNENKWVWSEGGEPSHWCPLPPSPVDEK